MSLRRMQIFIDDSRSLILSRRYCALYARNEIALIYRAIKRTLR